MKALILYFSGTGNTEYIARHISEQVHANRCSVDIYPVEFFNKENAHEYDILIFGFPIYGCGLAHFIKDYIKGIANIKTKAVFLFCTYGFFNGPAIHDAQKALKENGDLLMGYAEIKMPYSGSYANYKKESAAVKRLKSRDFTNIKEVDELISNIKKIRFVIETERDITKHKVKAKTNIIREFGHWGFKLIEPFLEAPLKSKFYADETCIKCKKCEKICPSKNITVGDSVEFDKKCYLCMRCVNQCPKDSIQVGKKTVGRFRWKGPKHDFNPVKYAVIKKVNK